MGSTEIITDKIAYHIDDSMELTITINHHRIKTATIKNVRIGIFRIGEIRTEIMLSTGGQIEPISDNQFKVTINLPKPSSTNLYCIGNLQINYSVERGFQNLFLAANRDFDLRVFQISNQVENSTISQKEINEKVKLLSKKQSEYVNRNYVTTKAHQIKDGNKNYKVILFCRGCMVHNKQTLNGYIIEPLKGGLSYSFMNNVMNEYLKEKIGKVVDFDEEIDKKYKDSQPLFVIEFLNVTAVDEKDAFTFSQSISDNIFTVLANVRGRRPNLFAYVVINLSSNELYHEFVFQPYRANILAGFNPNEIANKIDQLVPIFQNNPWLKFLFNSYSHAINEPNTDIRCFKLWTILEVIAKNNIENNITIIDFENNPILYENGDNIITTNTVAKIYQLLFENNLPNVNMSIQNNENLEKIIVEMGRFEAPQNKVEIIKLWDYINALYAVRNFVAHKGKFIIEEARLGNWRDRKAVYFLSFEAKGIFETQLNLLVNEIIQNQIEN